VDKNFTIFFFTQIVLICSYFCRPVLDFIGVQSSKIQSLTASSMCLL